MTTKITKKDKKHDDNTLYVIYLEELNLSSIIFLISNNSVF